MHTSFGPLVSSFIQVKDVTKQALESKEKRIKGAAAQF